MKSGLEKGSRTERASSNLGLETVMTNEEFLSFENEYKTFNKVLSFQEINDVKNTSKKRRFVWSS